MRVGINATCLNERPSGAKQRFIGIYGSLFNLRPDIVFILYEPSDCRVSEWFPRQANIQPRQTPIPSTGRFKKLFAGWYYWKKAFKRDRLDIFESMHLPLISSDSIVTLLTVHDIRGIYPGNSLIKRLVWASELRKGLAKADHVITVSSAMRDEIHRINPRCDVSVIYNGIDGTSLRAT
jgi:glycosyltransferase involved in cell wall biosynthesis